MDNNELTFYNYKEPMIAIPEGEGFGYYGCLMATANGDKVQCHIDKNVQSGKNKVEAVT